jgi:hypothetical protein
MTKKRRSSDFTREASIVRESVERRRRPRGPVSGLEAVLPDDEKVAVLEAGRRGIFVALEDPDRFALGARLDLVLSGRGRHVRARVEVVRKEIDPRRGVALLIVHMSPGDEAAFHEMLGA